MIKKIIKKSFIYEKFRLLKDIRDISKIKTVDCDPLVLGHLDREDLAKIWGSERTASAWTEIKEKINTLALKDSPSGMNAGDRQAIFFLASFFRPVKVLEVGTSVGYSTLYFALALDKNQNNVLLKTVDIRDMNDEKEKSWLESGSDRSPKELLSSVGAENLVDFQVSDSLEFLKNSQEKFDMIFLDGSHRAEFIYQEIPLAIRLLNKDGILLLHDYFPGGKKLWPGSGPLYGPYLAVKDLIKKYPEIKALPLDELPWETKAGSKKTSLAIITK